MIDFFIQIFWLMAWTSAFVMAVEQFYTTFFDYKAIKDADIKNGRRLIAQTSFLVICCLLVASGLNVVPGILSLALSSGLFEPYIVSTIDKLCLLISALCVVCVLVLKRRGRFNWEEEH